VLLEKPQLQCHLWLHPHRHLYRKVSLHPGADERERTSKPVSGAKTITAGMTSCWKTEEVTCTPLTSVRTILLFFTWSDRQLPGVLTALIELKVPGGREHAGCGLVLLPEISDGIPLDLIQLTALQDLSVKEIAGRWVKKGANASECVCGECIHITRDGKPILFCVESNQIYVHAHYQLNPDLRKAYLLFDDVAEVGTGGAALPWGKFDKQQPLAEIDLSRLAGGTISVEWLGLRKKGGLAKEHTFGKAYAGTYPRAKESDRR
jgi:hypothetical protein